MRRRAAFDTTRDFLVGLWNEAQRDQIANMGAALAYYAVFSLGPLLFLIVHIAGLALSEPLAESRVIAWVTAIIGPEGAGILRLMIETANQHGGGWFATWMGLGSLLAGAIGMVFQLKTSLNAIWGAHPPAPAGLVQRAVATVRGYVIPILMIVATGFLLVLSLTLNAVLLAFGSRFQAWLPGGASLWIALNQVTIFLLIVSVLSLMYRYLSDVRPTWPEVWVGSLVTALLFLVGKYAMAFYLGHSHLETSYGAAGSLVVLLVWIYYSTQLLFVGAEIIKLQSRRPHPSATPPPKE